MKTLAAHKNLALISLSAHRRLLGGGFTAAALALAVCAGGLADRGAALYRASHVRYVVRIAGEGEGGMPLSFRKLVDAEAIAHRLIGNPETEQEKGQAVLILDESGKLVDEIRD